MGTAAAFCVIVQKRGAESARLSVGAVLPRLPAIEEIAVEPLPHREQRSNRNML